jgi:hypothetical protein
MNVPAYPHQDALNSAEVCKSPPDADRLSVSADYTRNCRTNPSEGTILPSSLTYLATLSCEQAAPSPPRGAPTPRCTLTLDRFVIHTHCRRKASILHAPVGMLAHKVPGNIYMRRSQNVTKKLSDVACVRGTGRGFFEGVCAPSNTTAYLRDLPPTASRFANGCSVPGLQQVEHGNLRPSVLLLSVSPTNRLMRLG